jgi:putative acetyltransferase
MLTITQVDSATEIAAARGLIREYLAWWQVQQPDDFNQAPAFKDIEQEMAALPGLYAPPAGRLLLAQQTGQPAGCVCLKPLAAGTAEVKRLYVRPAFRGLNIGPRLIDRLVAEARSAGYRRIELDTHITMRAAQALYAAAGFKLASPPRGSLEPFQDRIIYMALDLPPAG